VLVGESIVHAPDGYRDASELPWRDADKPSYVRLNATLVHAELLGIPAGEPMLVRSVLQVSGDIRRVHRTYLPFSVAATTPWAEDAALPDVHDVYAHFASTMPRLHWREYARARMPLPDEAESLHAVPGTPVIQVTRLTWSKDNPLLMEEFISLGEALEVAYDLPITKTSR
jgi:GntR family transcriptional regulator